MELDLALGAVNGEIRGCVADMQCHGNLFFGTSKLGCDRTTQQVAAASVRLRTPNNIQE
jgi:hypothetical protein